MFITLAVSETVLPPSPRQAPYVKDMLNPHDHASANQMKISFLF